MSRRGLRRALQGRLAGVRVLDLTRLLPGPMCTLYLADLGADVDQGRGHRRRRLRAQPRAGIVRGHGRDRPRGFARSIAASVRSPSISSRATGIARSWRWRETADVVVEGFRPGVLARLRSTTMRCAPSIRASSTASLGGYGQTGPRAAMAAGHDINYLGYAGVLEYTGARGGAPALSNLQIADLLGGAASAAIAILAALFGAQRSGRGRCIDVAMATPCSRTRFSRCRRWNATGATPRVATTC